MQHPYNFGKNAKILMRHVDSKTHINATPNGPTAHAAGGTGVWAQWETELENGMVRLKNVSTGKYLRILPEGKGIDVNGGKGPYTLFKIHKLGDGIGRLESNATANKYVGVKDKDAIVAGGGPFSKLAFFSDTPEVSGPFSKPYLFMKNNTIIMRHVNSTTHINATPNGDTAHAAGGKGIWAQWETTLENGLVRFKNVSTGKYLRIKDGGKVVDVGGGTGPFTLFKFHKESNGVGRLESNKFSGKFIAVKEKEALVGGGGPLCNLQFFRKD
jgi:hypothetical protein